MTGRYRRPRRVSPFGTTLRRDWSPADIYAHLARHATDPEDRRRWQAMARNNRRTPTSHQRTTR